MKRLKEDLLLLETAEVNLLSCLLIKINTHFLLQSVVFFSAHRELLSFTIEQFLYFLFFTHGKGSALSVY